MPVGEAIVTLQDVGIICTIDGPLITRGDTTRSVDEWENLFAEFIGFKSTELDIDGRCLKVRCLAKALDIGFLEDASEEFCRQCARIYLLLLLEGIYFQTNRKIKCFCDIYLCSATWRPWDGVVLTFLYRSDAASPAAFDVSRPLTLL